VFPASEIPGGKKIGWGRLNRQREKKWPLSIWSSGEGEFDSSFTVRGSRRSEKGKNCKNLKMSTKALLDSGSM